MPPQLRWKLQLHGNNSTVSQAELRRSNKILHDLLSQPHLSAGDPRPLDVDLREGLLSWLEPLPRESPCREPDRDLHKTLSRTTNFKIHIFISNTCTKWKLKLYAETVASVVLYKVVLKSYSFLLFWRKSNLNEKMSKFGFDSIHVMTDSHILVSFGKKKSVKRKWPKECAVQQTKIYTFSIVNWSHWSNYTENLQENHSWSAIHLPSFSQIDTVAEAIYQKMSKNDHQNSISISVLLMDVMFLLCNC